ncbi:kinesin-domain-containing protein [Cylindrobasidium torrendii FP15055 ss-10]|uniref:Kinesin-domain-containing protein n=1 Tax=Cylindrobasidium torrendii FP15055 ss-10 TaxID=1314674 RepID=A0A0D7ARR0_9AGAR|nr:kinesin-domain-containing protein [Cylindrobasidium torrendii FP15055 ss-10]
MATRRPASRARNPPSQVPSRPPSVMGRPARNNDSTSSQPRPRAAPTPSQSQTKESSSAQESNIQVVIRCRRRSEREIEANSPVCVTSNGAKSNQISIETTAPTSTLGLVTLPPTRTYPFDLVFGPEADQALLYHEVVNPMLEEVLAGYNCTLFAYGQTGTGKTYTMHGDLIPSPMGNPSVHAGMIPRVLFRLFHYLENSASDFSVKVSYIELYNEELRDLLAPDLAAPNGNVPSMGKDSSKNSDGGLKIFDNTNKAGVYIQGVEEVAVSDCSDALNVLQKGSTRRQTAATKFNDHSSRSHSIFTITVHIKEAGLVGEDLLKTGKLNLVDLAGSENIGRSGAQNTRAREAGMINQSLLTLGRVINALVDKASHVPYRESKLTRLLQDSLGGRTKTCIVATVSPARCNLEETLSTLDYAMHAKDIRNKPELNQRMTRNSLIKEYVAEIERLKADVLAAREKNGIFFSEETWNQISAEHEMQKTELKEAKEQVEVTEGRLRAVREEFDQSIGLLKLREKELADTKTSLASTETDLKGKTAELGAVKIAFEEEVVYRKAFEQTESVLDGVAQGLRDVAHQSVADVGDLFVKLDRKSEIMAGNTKAVVTHGKTIATATRSLSRQLDTFLKTSSMHTSELSKDAKAFGSSELAQLATHATRLHQHIEKLKDKMGIIATQDKSEEEALKAVKQMISETHATLRDGFGAWGAELSRTCREKCEAVETTSAGAFVNAEKSLKMMGQVVESVLRDAFKFIEGERQGILRARDVVAAAANGEIQRLKAQNQKLMQLLDAERAGASAAKADLVSRISGMLGTFVNERDQALRAAVQPLVKENEVGQTAMKDFVTKHDEVLDEMESEGSTVSTAMEKKNGDVKRTRDGAFKALTGAKTSLGSDLANLNSSMTSSIDNYSDEIQHRARDMDEMSKKNFGAYHRAKRIRLETTDTMSMDVGGQYRSLDGALASTSKNVDAFVDRVTASGSTLQTEITQYNDATGSHISSLNGATTLLSTEGARPDVSSGSTPKKRAWNYVDEWERTESRESVLRGWREQGVSEVGNETFTAEHLPLPDGLDEDEASGSEVVEPEVVEPEVEEQEDPPTPPPPPPRQRRPTLKERTRSREPSAPDPLVDTKNVYLTRGSRRVR